MNKRCFGILVIVGLCLAAVPLAAHHALAAQYDMDKPIEITGTLNKMEFINPHSMRGIQLLTSDSSYRVDHPLLVE